MLNKRNKKVISKSIFPFHKKNLNKNVYIVVVFFQTENNRISVIEGKYLYMNGNAFI